MGAKGEALAKQFEAKVQEATGVLEKLTDADWKKKTSGEQWTVGVVAHHVAGGHEGISGIIKTVASGQSMSSFTMDMLHGMNAKHAQEFANATKAETLALHKKNAATAAAVVRGLSDADLARSGTVLTGDAGDDRRADRHQHPDQPRRRARPQHPRRRGRLTTGSSAP